MGLLTSTDCLRKYGDPNRATNMILWTVPEDIRKAIPAFVKQGVKKIYMNLDMVHKFEQGMRNAMDRGFAKEIVEWNGCFNIRQKVSSGSWSLHSWGVAFDINASTNGYNKKGNMSSGLAKCFTDAGFTWGGTWRILDKMHFQLLTI